MLRIDNKDFEEFASLAVPVGFFETILSQRYGSDGFFAVHGVREIYIIQIVPSYPENLVYLLVRSKDIPSWVSYHKMLGDLEYVPWGDYQIPKLILHFGSFPPIFLGGLGIDRNIDGELT